jgi:hypothetical protein
MIKFCIVAQNGILLGEFEVLWKDVYLLFMVDTLLQSSNLNKIHMISQFPGVRNPATA